MFSSQVSQVPHGVMPPAQLLNMPIDAAAGGIGRRLHARMAGGRTGDVHRRVGVDAARIFRAGDHLPLAAVPLHLDDRPAVRGNFDVGALERRAGARRVLGLRPRQAGEHQLLVGVFVVDHEQTMRRRIGRARNREISEVVVVVSELQPLGGGGVRRRIERRRPGQHRIAPADQHVGVVAGSDVMIFVGAGFELVEAVARRRFRLGAPAAASASGDTAVAMAATPSAPLSTSRRAKRAAITSPSVGLSVGLRPTSSDSSRAMTDGTAVRILSVGIGHPLDRERRKRSAAPAAAKGSVPTPIVWPPQGV